GLNTSVGQASLTPSHTSSRSHGPAAGRQVTPAFLPWHGPAGGVLQFPDESHVPPLPQGLPASAVWAQPPVPSQWSLVHGLLSSVQEVWVLAGGCWQALWVPSH